MTDTFDHSHDDEDFDPGNPDPAHAVTGDETTDPADTQPGTGEELNPGDLPGDIPVPPPDKEL